MSARGINKVILVGRLGNDPEVRYIPNGGAVANLQVATSESWRDKQTGEMREPVSYTHIRAHETVQDIVCRILLEKKKKSKELKIITNAEIDTIHKDESI